MGVHKDLILHAKKQNEQYNTFTFLDEQREMYIQEAVELCQTGQAFTTNKINEVTRQINVLANDRFIPARKFVTPEMVETYVESLKSNSQ